MQKFYAGIGSRETPYQTQLEMRLLASYLEAIGFTLRSGNASGADQAFASGVKSHAQIWLPWDSFEKEFRLKHPEHEYHTITEYDQEAFTSVDRYHPSPTSLTDAGKKFMARNYRQIIGTNEPNSEFVICWTPDGKAVGGTAQAIRIANDYKIPVINMYKFETADRVIDRLIIWNDI
jgi:hypothetical protein